MSLHKSLTHAYIRRQIIHRGFEYFAHNQKLPLPSDSNHFFKKKKELQSWKFIKKTARDTSYVLDYPFHHLRIMFILCRHKSQKTPLYKMRKLRKHGKTSISKIGKMTIILRKRKSCTREYHPAPPENKLLASLASKVVYFCFSISHNPQCEGTSLL